MNYVLSIKQLLLRLLLLVFLYQFCRANFYFFNQPLFSNVGAMEFLGGLRFDLSAIFFSNALIIILSSVPGNFKYTPQYQKVLKILFFIINAVFIATNFIDVKYFEFTGKRSTFALITASGMKSDLVRLLPSFLKSYWYLFLLYVVTIASFWKLIPTLTYAKEKSYKNTGNSIIFKCLCFAVLCGLVVLIGRGGFQRKPLMSVDAINYAGSTQNTAVVLNTPFTIFRTLSKKEDLKKQFFFNENTLSQIYQPYMELTSSQKFDKKNVVIIILESFGKENIGLEFNGRKLTPFLDSLLTQGRYYSNAFANGLKSIDAVPSVITSIPCLMEISYISSPFSFNKVDGFNNILKKQGYHTAFFHGAFNGSQNFNEFAKIAGYNQYFGKNEYSGPESFDGKWGVFDEEFLQFTAEKLTTFRPPFFATIFTLSSHVPYTIPEKYQNQFPKGNRKIHESVAYSDYALRKFFETAKKQSWYKNTLFILTPDHTSRGEKPKEYNTGTGDYTIPILFFDPSNPSLKNEETKLFEQIDILPEVLQYLHFSGKIFSFGNAPDQETRLVANFSEGVYRFIIDDYYLIFDGTKILNVYDYKKDRLLQNPLKNYPAQKLESQIKAYIQQYNNRMIDNQLSAISK